MFDRRKIELNMLC